MDVPWFAYPFICRRTSELVLVWGSMTRTAINIHCQFLCHINFHFFRVNRINKFFRSGIVGSYDKCFIL